mmetsp:Transcript_8071/g.23076  ORF Transcript_8071/g.23076 Transcript_8071/m.23076 type:complete len:294 (+) Transcript_8071:1572-2453(+)
MTWRENALVIHIRRPRCSQDVIPAALCIWRITSSCCNQPSRASLSFSRPESMPLSMVAEAAARTQPTDSFVNSAATSSLSMAWLLKRSSLKARWILCLDLLTAPSLPEMSCIIMSNHSSWWLLSFPSCPSSSVFDKVVSTFLLMAPNLALFTGRRCSTNVFQSSGRSLVSLANSSGTAARFSATAATSSPPSSFFGSSSASEVVSSSSASPAFHSSSFTCGGAGSSEAAGGAHKVGTASFSAPSREANPLAITSSLFTTPVATLPNTFSSTLCSGCFFSSRGRSRSSSSAAAG